MKNRIIEAALKFLSANKYQPEDIAFYVTVNGKDTGNEDCCGVCIDKAIEQERRYYRNKRVEINAKYDLIEAVGYYVVNGERKALPAGLKKSFIQQLRRSELREYPAKAKFDYDNHDPDFGGGLEDVKACDLCGKYFDVYVTIKEDYLKYIEERSGFRNLSDADKFYLERMLSHWKFCDAELIPRIETVCKLILQDNNISI